MSARTILQVLRSAKAAPICSTPSRTFHTISIPRHSWITCGQFTRNIKSFQRQAIPGSWSFTNCLVRDYVTKSNLQEQTRSMLPNVPISPVTKKKSGLHKKTPENGYKAYAYGTSEHINLVELQQELQDKQVYEVRTDLPKDLTDVLIVEAKYSIGNEKREVFFFRKGAIVFWNVPEIERVSILRATRRFQRFAWDGEEMECLTYQYTDSPTCVITDPDPDVDIHIQKSPANSEELLQKYAISNSLMATVKLGIYENQLERRMDYFWAILLDLKQGKLHLTRDETLQQIGEQSMLRYYINMRSDLLDPPDFYWDRDSLEQLYFEILELYSIDKRTEVINKKLDSSIHLIEILRDHLTNTHSSELEKLIIFLIFLEVLFSLDHYGLGPEAMVNMLKRRLNIGPNDVPSASEAAASEEEEEATGTQQMLSMDNPY